MKKLPQEFYLDSALEVAPRLLGKILVHETSGKKLAGRIVEVEAYMGPKDKAAHSYNNLRTKRNEIMYGIGGHAYVYLIYGLYYCLNVVTANIDEPQGVLIRGIIPYSGLDEMAYYRFQKRYQDLSKSQIKNLTNGPGKLTQALNITMDQYGLSFNSDRLYILDYPCQETIMQSLRINIDYAEEARFYPWRFYLKEYVPK